jgi:precorrin-6B methylase 2
VTSLEILPEAASLAARNVERSGLASRARLIVGGAPENIPQGEFDAIFIGGHGGALERIIQICWERLRPEGRLLVTAITPSTTSRTLACLGDINAKTGFWRTHTSAGHRAGAEWLLAGNNPIDFIWGDR